MPIFLENEMMGDPLDDLNTFESRMEFLIDAVGGVKKACEISRVSRSTVDNWKNGRASPMMSKILDISVAANISLDWIATGEGEIYRNQPTANAADQARREFNSATEVRNQPHFFSIPQFKVGIGEELWKEADIRVGANFFRHVGKALSATLSRVVAYEVFGSEMSPQINPGDLVLIARQKQVSGNGIYLLAVDDDLLMRNVQRTADGGAMLLTKNASFFDEKISPEQLKSLNVIGRIFWHSSFI